MKIGVNNLKNSEESLLKSTINQREIIMKSEPIPKVSNLVISLYVPSLNEKTILILRQIKVISSIEVPIGEAQIMVPIKTLKKSKKSMF